MKVRRIEIHSTEKVAPTIVERVTHLGAADGVYWVRDAAGAVYRFPVALVRLIVEYPPTRE